MDPLAHPVSRRRFLRQTLSWSALGALPTLPSVAAVLPAFKPSDPHAAHALVLGDWGYRDKLTREFTRGDGGPPPTTHEATHEAQTQVARGMRHYAQATGMRPEALWMLGDSWYGDLPDGVASSRWVEGFEQMYPADVFPGPAYTMLGNHDYQTMPADVNKVQAELAYAKAGRGVDGKPTRWTLPARWYAFDFPAKNPLIHCIVLDSNVGHEDGKAPHAPNFLLTPDQYAEQMRWFEAELAKPRTTPYLAVLAHHPVYSNGPHGDHPVLVRDWDPLFRKYNVDLYMAGHDHDLQHLEFAGHPTTHFLSGGGGADLYVLKIDGLDRGPYAQQIHGFSHLSVTKNALELRHVDSDGRVLYGISRAPGGKVTPLRV